MLTQRRVGLQLSDLPAFAFMISSYYPGSDAAPPHPALSPKQAPAHRDYVPRDYVPLRRGLKLSLFQPAAPLWCPLVVTVLSAKVVRSFRLKVSSPFASGKLAGPSGVQNARQTAYSGDCRALLKKSMSAHHCRPFRPTLYRHNVHLLARSCPPECCHLGASLFGIAKHAISGKPQHSSNPNAIAGLFQ